MTTATSGGVWSTSLELCRAFRAQGIEVVLATFGRVPSSEQLAEVGELANVDVRLSTFKAEWMDQPWRDVDRSGEWLLSLEAECRPDLIHLNGYAHGALATRAPRVVAGHSCILSWSDPDRDEAERGIYHRRVRAGIGGAAAVVAPSGMMLEALDRYYGPLPMPRVIPGGKDPRWTFRNHRKEELIFFASSSPNEVAPPAQRDLSAILDRHLGILERARWGVRWPIYFAGPGGKRRGLTGLGAISGRGLGAWFGRASIFVLPLADESMTVPVLEAALAGCVLVLADRSGVREMWGDAAEYVVPDDPAHLRDKLKSLIDDAPWRSILSARARERAAAHSARRMGESYTALYREVIRRRA